MTLKALVSIKRVVDPYVRVRIKRDQSGVETANVKMAMNPFDEIAVEEAVRLKEKGIVSEIIVVSIGNTQCQETLRNALALGADKAILIQTDQLLEPLTIAKILKTLVEKNQPDIVIMGKQSIDGDNNQTGQMLAALLQWPQATFASKLTINGREAEVMREIDGGLETIKVNLPAIITTDLRLNEPRYAALPNIMKAKQKPLETIALENIMPTIQLQIQILKITEPPTRQAGKRVASVAELVQKLHNEAKVI